MTLTVEEIKDLTDPYATLGTSAALNEHRAELNQLSTDEMEALANKMIQACPQEKMGDFWKHINEFKSDNSAENTFHALIITAYFIKLSKSDNPYLELGNPDALASHRTEFNKLSADDMKDLASRMVLGCPESELKNFGRAIEALRNPTDDYQSFHEVIAQAYSVKKLILSLMDVKNKKPHEMILGSELDEELFINYKDLAQKVLNDNESAIAGRLAETTPGGVTPKDYRDLVEKKIINIFPNSLLATKVGHAFTVRRDIDNLLLGENPHEFFASRDYNIGSNLEFAHLFEVTTRDKESSIATKLALHTPPEKRSEIANNIKSISPSKSLLAPKVDAAFEMRRNMDRFLFGDKPDQFFTDRGFSHEMCDEFSELFTLTKGKESKIAAQLALTTAPEKRSDIAQKINSLHLADNLLAEKVRGAFELRSNVDKYLLGDQPYKFFTDEGFSVALCHEFSKLISTLLKGLEQLIGEKLGEISDSRVRSDINRKMEMINKEAHNQTSTFRLIATAMASRVESQQHSNTSPVTEETLDVIEPASTGDINEVPKTDTPQPVIEVNPDVIEPITPIQKLPPVQTSIGQNQNTLFKSQLQHRKPMAVELPIGMDDESDEDKEDNCSYSSCCNLFK